MIDAVGSISSSALASAMRKASTAETSSSLADPAVAATSFSDFMSSMGTTFTNSLKTAETTSMDGMLGKASTRDVVDAVMTADQTLQTAMAFRDKIVSAYLEIVKMPI